jgi:hypothetical protein
VEGLKYEFPLDTGKGKYKGMEILQNALASFKSLARTQFDSTDSKVK